MRREMAAAHRSTIMFFVIFCTSAASADQLNPCTSQIFCHGDLLDSVQRARLFKDSKFFVDMRLKFDPAEVLRNFSALGKDPTKEALKKFVSENFLEAGHDLDAWSPEDWNPKPEPIDRVKDPNLKAFGSALNNLWKKLGRKISAEAHKSINRSSLIVVDKPFIVPGGRFREYYYWDSYWVINGLLVCGMKDTARDMIDNFVQLVRMFGFVPNGGRVYYTNRSQPPFLIPIVDSYLRFTNDDEYVKRILGDLEKEYLFWVQHRSVEVESTEGRVYQLNVYAARMNTPRPESYYEDVTTAEGLPTATKAELFRDIASAAESGWDFSTRWFNRSGPGAGTLRSARTRQLVPVDLNSILFRCEKILEKFYRLVGKTAKADSYEKTAESRREAIEAVLWDARNGLWFDYDRQLQRRNVAFYASSVVPLWAGIHRGNVTRENVVLSALKSLGVLSYPGGLPTSLNESGEQWDFPNAWPPLQHMLITALAQSTSKEVQKEGFLAAQKWIRTNYKAWRTTGHMMEKFNVTVQGAPGGGGEYDIQTGFGWTNGVVLDLLHRYPDELEVSDHAKARAGTMTGGAPALGFLLSIMFNFVGF